MKLFKIKFAFLGCLVFPIIFSINLFKAGIEILPTLFVFPIIVGAVSGFFIGHMKDNWLKLNSELEFLVEQRTAALQKALDEVKILQGIIPICSYCKQIRDDKGAWSRIEKYISENTDAEFSHGICPDCLEKQMAELDKEE